MGKITINDKEFEFKEGETIFQIARREGIFIPTYCYHSQLRIVASCRICLVEVRMNNKEFIVTSCSTPAQDGMIVYTDSEKVLRERYAIMQFLLLNHPPECPVCDEGGQCLLQDFTEYYGPVQPLFKYKKDYKKYDTGPLIRFYPELCILCDRCYRFWKEELNEDEIISKERGSKTYVGPYEDVPILKGFSNYLIDICPVGAFLDNTSSKFSVRPWDLKKIDTRCPLCSLFCEIRAYKRRETRTRSYRGGKKLLPDRIYNIKYQNKGIIDSIICDRGKFGKDFLLSNYILSKARIKGEWKKIDIDEVFLNLKKKIEKYPSESIGIILSARMGNEDIDILKDVLINRMGIMNFMLTPGIIDSSANLMLSDFNLSDIKRETFILHTGYDFFYSHPVTGLEILRRLRKFPEEIVPAYFKTPPFKQKMPFLFSISYQQGKVQKEANEFFLADFKKSFKLNLAIFSELYKSYGVRKEAESRLLNYFSFIRKIENMDVEEVLNQVGFEKRKFNKILNRIKNANNIILVYQDFIPFEIQKILNVFRYLNLSVKNLILRFSPNTEYLLRKKFPLVSFEEFYDKVKKGLIRLVVFIHTNPFLEIYPFSKIKEIFGNCETLVLDTFKGLHTEISQNVIPLKSMFEKESKVVDNYGNEKVIKKVIKSERVDLVSLFSKFEKENFEEINFFEKIEIDFNKNFKEVYFAPSLYNFGYETLFSETLNKVKKPSYLFFPFENEKRAEEFEKIC